MSLEREARILIVDDQREIARVLRTALELSDRGYFVIDVPSGEEALLELGRVEFDLIVSDYRLPGMSGPELIERIRRRRPEIKAMLITGNPVNEVKGELATRNVEVVRIFEKPIDTQAFAEAVRAAVFGETQVEIVAAAEGQAGAIPQFDEGAIARQLSSLRVDLGARGVSFISRAGQVLLKDGAVDDLPRFGELAVLLAHNFATTTEIASYLGEQETTAVFYYDGSWYDIYALSVSTHFFIVILFPGGSQKQMGPVLRYGKPAVKNILEAISSEEQAAVARMPAPGVVSAEHEPEMVADQEARGGAYEEPALVGLGDFSTMPLRGGGEPIGQIDLDLEALDAALDAGTSNLDSFWEEAASSATRVSDEALSLDEAIELGLIPKDAEIE